MKQLKIANAMKVERSCRSIRPIIDKELPYSIGGGIGQSRLCMFFLRKAHVGEVQVSVWPDDMVEECKANNIFLL